MAATFVYKAKDRTGQLMTGSILADSETAVASYIREKGYFVTEIKKKKRKCFFRRNLRKPSESQYKRPCCALPSVFNHG